MILFVSGKGRAAAKARIDSVGGFKALHSEDEHVRLQMYAYGKQNELFHSGENFSLKAMTFPGAYSECLHRNEIALTFDDGPSEYTHQVLDILAEEQVKGTFFLIGMNVDSIDDSKYLIRRMINEGHSIGSHTYTHPDLTTLSDEEIVHELKLTEKALRTVGASVPPEFFRPPYGSLDDRVMNVLDKNGYETVVLWNVDTSDWKDHTCADFSLATIYKDELPSTKYALILQHDTYYETMNTLQASIKVIKKMHRKIVTLSRCLFG